VSAIPANLSGATQAIAMELDCYSAAVGFGVAKASLWKRSIRNVAIASRSRDLDVIFFVVDLHVVTHFG
jgi:hypothetical protein